MQSGIVLLIQSFVDFLDFNCKVNLSHGLFVGIRKLIGS